MNPRVTLGVILILMLAQLASCRGYIPVTGKDTPTPAGSAEDDVVPTPSELSQPSLQATETLAAPTASPETLTCQTPTASIKADNVYLRKGPDIRFLASDRYKNGDRFTILSGYKDWFLVESAEGKQGWLYKDWLTLPEGIDTINVCSVPLDQLPPTPEALPNNPMPTQNDKQCVPTYYDSCD